MHVFPPLTNLAKYGSYGSPSTCWAQWSQEPFGSPWRTVSSGSGMPCLQPGTNRRGLRHRCCLFSGCSLPPPCPCPNSPALPRAPGLTARRACLPGPPCPLAGAVGRGDRESGCSFLPRPLPALWCGLQGLGCVAIARVQLSIAMRKPPFVLALPDPVRGFTIPYVFPTLINL